MRFGSSCNVVRILWLEPLTRTSGGLKMVDKLVTINHEYA